MNTNARRIQLSAAAGLALALVAMPVAAAQSAVPGTTAHHFSSHPMIAGTVVSVNDHEMVVDSDQGEQLTLELDSRTLAPRDLAPGMVMRADFQALEDCRLYAERIVPLRSGMSAERMQAYANTRDQAAGVASAAMPNAVSRREHVLPGGQNRVTAPQEIGEHSAGSVMTAVPGTRDYGFSTRPLLSGRVRSVNDHSLVLDTEQGRRVAMTMDSRTLVPADVAPGTYLRIEFSQMKDGRFYAKRVGLVADGVAAREQAYAHTRDSEYLLAHEVPDCGYVAAPTPSTVSTSVTPGEPATTAPVAQQARETDTGRTLPQTASGQPLLLLMGLLALASAGLLAAIRRGRAG